MKPSLDVLMGFAERSLRDTPIRGMDGMFVKDEDLVPKWGQVGLPSMDFAAPLFCAVSSLFGQHDSRQYRPSLQSVSGRKHEVEPPNFSP
ncbi:MAG: hypothetical protein KJ970_20950 [Candidatus Eisenbacteria bacterium]|uniref:Uncharacterized protein n=1 Tax=Eiseniibacteriota bacterium TaxID=2212470 RepID=A0A948RZR5_UNCEI|nr:hypothetical protein [Candidatus Eisenbacteria bacterium]